MEQNEISIQAKCNQKLREEIKSLKIKLGEGKSSYKRELDGEFSEKIKSVEHTISRFIKLQEYLEEYTKTIEHWRSGGAFMECEGCGGLRREKTGNRTR